MSSILKLLLENGINQEMVQLLLKYDQTALDKIVTQIIKDGELQDSYLTPIVEQNNPLLEQTAFGYNPLSSGLTDPVVVHMNNKYHSISEAISFPTTSNTNETNVSEAYVQPQVYYYVPKTTPTETAVTPVVPPEKIGTLSASVEITEITNLFHEKTAIDTVSFKQYHVEGQTINYRVTQTEVSLTTAGSWGDINTILFTGDTHDLANKTLNFVGFKSVDVLMFDSPVYSSLPKSGLNLDIDGAKEGLINATSVADTVTIKHSTDNSVGTFTINTLDGDDRVYIQPSTHTYSVNGVPNDNSGLNIITQIDTGNGNDLVDASSSLSQNNVILGQGDDRAYGGGGIDIISGGVGSDLIYGGAGNDQLSGNEDADTLYGENGNDVLHGGDGDDSLLGNDGDDSIYGDDGNDIIEGGNGTNYLEGNDGDDTFNVNAGETGVNTFMGGSGTDKIVAAANATINLSQTYNSSNSIEEINGAGSNTIQGSNSVSNNWDFSTTTLNNIALIQSGSNADTIIGSLGDDTINGGQGADNIAGNLGNDTLYGGDGNDTLLGNDGDDTIYGEDGNDTIEGGNGINILDGGNGNDTFQVNAGETGSNSFQGGLGTDRILALGNATIYLDQNFNSTNSIEQISGTAGSTNIIQGQNGVSNDWNFAYLTAITMTNINAIRGGDAADTIRGSQGGDIIQGNDGDDTIYGEDGNDTIAGGNGINILNGGNGNDIFQVNAGETGSNSFQGGAGTDRILALSDATIYLDQNFNSTNSIEQITGTAGLSNNTIQGQNGVSNNWNFAYLTAANMTNIDAIQGGDAADTIRGSQGADVIQGNSGNDTLYGGLGNDTLRGNDGDDTIYGDDGNDTIEGGNGNNILDGGAGNDIFRISAGETGISTYQGGTGTDQILALANATINLEQNFNASNSIEQINGTAGATSTNIIQGRDAVDENWNFSAITLTNIDAIQTGAGNDTVVGSNGNDIISGNQGEDIISGGGGNDTIRGNEDNDTLYGNDGNDTIFGDDGDDIIEGNNGTNTLNGGEGNDTFRVNTGETGINTFQGGNGLDQVVAATDATIFLNGNFNASNSIEQINGTAGASNNVIQGQNASKTWDFSNTTLTNIDAINTGTGTNTVTGSTAADIINGNSGIDTINGNSGNDIIHGYANNDILRGNDGDDTIYGDDGNDTIEGGNGNNILDGGAGNDIFRIYAGETGISTYQGGTGTDQILALANATINLEQNFNASNSIEQINGTAGATSTNIIQGRDAIDENWNFSTITLTNIDAIQTGAGNDTVVGSNGNDIISGNQGEDIISGGGGNDTIRGNEDNDILYGNDGNDTIFGDDGDDIIEGNNGTNTLNGGEGNDTFRINTGETGINTFQGGNGLDQVVAATDATIFLNGNFNASNSIEQINGTAGASNNVIQGQNASKTWDFSSTTLTDIDAINTGSGTNTVTGSLAADIINGNSGIDTINGNSGNDIIHGFANNDILRGNDGDDTIYGGDGNDTIFGDDGDDIIEGNNGTNTLNGGEGNDTFRVNAGETGVNTFQGGNGTDQIVALTDATIFLNTTFSATNSIEQINGTAGASTNIIQGRDTVAENWDFSATILTEIDRIQTGNGNDTVTGSTGNDTIDGGLGNDTLRGNNGDDTLYGNDGNDILFGDAGNDFINDGAGNDRSDGGANIDTAILRYSFSNYSFSYNASTQIETITNNVSGLETDTYVNFEFYNFNGVLYSFSAGTFTAVMPPVVLDLNHDGIKYSTNPILFDANGDNILDQTQWISAEDGILTYDKNHDGQLTDHSEISFVQYKEGAHTDLEGLRAFDTNHNNQLDVNDEQWSSFGVTQNNHFLNFDALNIVSIDLASNNNYQTPANGVYEFGQGVFHYSDGTTGKTADVAFAYHQISEKAVLGDDNNSLDTVLNQLGPKNHPTSTGTQHAAEALPLLQTVEEPILPTNEIV